MDVHSPHQRSYNMSCISSRNTKPELLIRRYLWKQGYRYRLNYKKLPGKPDIVFVSRKKAIFINGCFWHRHKCRYFKWPKTNPQFWKDKINQNVKRDTANYKKIFNEGWQFIVIWECDIKDRYLMVLSELEEFLH